MKLNSTMADREFKAHEAMLRRAVARLGFQLIKSRRRDPQAIDFGNYWIVDPQTRFLVEGGQWGMSLEEVEQWLKE